MIRRVFSPGSLPITRALGLAIGGLVVLAVLTVLGLQLYSSHANLLELMNRQLERTFRMIDLVLDDHLTPAAKQLEFLADLIEAGRYEPADRRRLADLLTGALAATPQIANLLFVGRDLRLLGVEQDPGYLPEILVVPSVNRERLKRVAAEMAAAEDARWGELSYFDGKAFLNLRRPVRRDGEYLGFLAALISVPELSQAVIGIGEADGTTAFILYGEDHVLAHPALVSPHPNLSVESPLVRIDRIGDPVLAAISEGVPMPALGGPGTGDIEVLRVDVNGTDYLVAYQWLDGYGQTPWRIGSWLPMESAMGAMKRLRYAALAGLAVAVLSLVLALALGRALARPIRRAAAGSAQIGALDLERVEPLPPSAITELDEQASAFNATLGALRSFETYVPRRLVMRLIHGASDGAVESQERQLTVLFTDIVGFTAMSEALPAPEVAAFLNRHFTLLAGCVEAEEGTIDKYIGDALMAFWGAPDVQADHAARACRAACAIARGIETDNAARAAAGRAPVRLRIGVHSGPAVVGNIGAPGRINYTIVGDTVNIAQRLETLGRAYDRGAAVTILVSEATAGAAGRTFALEEVGSSPVKGRSQPVAVFRLTPS